MQANGNEPKRVGIVTLTGDFNYGNKLQLFASMRLYEKLGYQPTYLAFNHKEPLIAHPKRLLKGLLPKATSETGVGFAQHDARAQAFRRFIGNIDTIQIDHVSDVNPGEFKYFAVGSDQVWNPRYAWPGSLYSGGDKFYHSLVDPHARDESLDWYFLRFAFREQRLTTAPSIGLDQLNARQAKWLAEGLDGFEKISIRERRGAELIDDLVNKRATVVCDPTLVLTRDDWALASADGSTPKAPYVFSYVLGARTDAYADILRTVTHNGEIPVVPLSDRMEDDEPDAGPAEFISLIANASHVVTDSFHASVFSAIFEKPLTIIRRGGDGSGSMFSRLESLTSTLGIADKIYTGGELDLSVAQDYEGVALAIAGQSERFVDYLEGCLDG